MGYWPSVRSRWLYIGQVLFCAFRDGDEVEVHKLAKKERGEYPAIWTEQTWSIKDLLYGFWGNFAWGIQRVVPSGQDDSILPARVANHSARFRSSCPLTELPMFSVRACTRAYSSTFQDLDFDVSLSPLFINWCYNHGIKKLPNHWWTRWYYFGTVKFFLIMEFW